MYKLNAAIASGLANSRPLQGHLWRPGVFEVTRRRRYRRLPRGQLIDSSSSVLASFRTASANRSTR
ncbi:hypothetical protein WP1_122 [Pseudomonas phage WP1]